MYCFTGPTKAIPLKCWRPVRTYATAFSAGVVSKMVIASPREDGSSRLVAYRSGEAAPPHGDGAYSNSPACNFAVELVLGGIIEMLATTCDVTPDVIVGNVLWVKTL